MNSVLSWLLAATAFGATIAGAVLHGNLSNRWSTSSSTDALVVSLKQVPPTIGEWDQTSERELGADAQKLLNCFADDIRIYQNRQTGREIQVALLLGPSGPISVHTPDICYSSRKYKKLGNRERVSPTEQVSNDNFWSVKFQSRDISGEFLRSIYGWSTDGHWESPDSSRFKYAGQPYLFKVEFATSGSSREEIEEDKSFEEFVREYSILLRKHLREGG